MFSKSITFNYCISKFIGQLLIDINTCNKFCSKVSQILWIHTAVGTNGRMAALPFLKRYKSARSSFPASLRKRSALYDGNPKYVPPALCIQCSLSIQNTLLWPNGHTAIASLSLRDRLCLRRTRPPNKSSSTHVRKRVVERQVRSNFLWSVSGNMIIPNKILDIDK